MPRSGERGGSRTRARIAEVANGLFLEHGFDAVTVAQVAKAAGVSSVTVFNHFPRKEDLFLDREEDAVELLCAAVRERAEGVSVPASLRAMTSRLVEERHPLSGLDPRSTPFFRTVAESPALVARAREIAAELQQVLADELDRHSTSNDDATLLAAFFLAGYTAVLVATARRLLSGESHDAVLADHAARFDRLFAALDAAFPAPDTATS